MLVVWDVMLCCWARNDILKDCSAVIFGSSSPRKFSLYLHVM